MNAKASINGKEYNVIKNNKNNLILFKNKDNHSSSVSNSIIRKVDNKFKEENGTIDKPIGRGNRIYQSLNKLTESYEFTADNYIKMILINRMYNRRIFSLERIKVM